MKPANFDALDQLLADVATNNLRPIDGSAVDGIAVDCPQMLGDTYEELVANLDKIATAGLLLSIEEPEKRRAYP